MRKPLSEEINVMVKHLTKTFKCVALFKLQNDVLMFVLWKLKNTSVTRLDK